MKIRPTRENLFLVLLFAAVIVTLIAIGSVEWFPIGAFAIAALGFLIGKNLVGRSLSFSHLTVPATFMFAYFLMMVLPSIYTFGEMDHPIRYTYLMAVQSVLITFPLGVYICDFFYPRPGETIVRFFDGRPGHSHDGDRYAGVVRVGIVVSIPIVVVFFMYSKYVPLWEMIKQYPTPVDAVALRFASNDSPLVVQFLFEILRRMILPVCTLFALFRSELPGGRWRRMYWALVLYTLGVSMLTLDRAPIFALIVMLVLGRALARNWSLRSAVTSVHAWKWIPLLGVLGGFISILQYQSDILWDTFIYNAWYVLSHRIFVDPSYMAAHYGFERFDDRGQLLHGRDVRLFSLFGGNYVDSVNGIGDPRNTVAPVTFVGDLWRNWGWSGVILGTIVMGAAIQFIQLRLIQRKNPMSMSLQVILILTAFYLIPGGALGIMTTAIMMLILAFTFVAPGSGPERGSPGKAGLISEIPSAAN